MVVCEKCKAEIIESTLDAAEPERGEWPIVCSDCGQDATVPFEPRQGGTVYCRDCYKKRHPR